MECNGFVVVRMNPRFAAIGFPGKGTHRKKSEIMSLDTALRNQPSASLIQVGIWQARF